MKISVNGKEKKIELENEKALLSSTLEFLGYKPVSYTHLTLPTTPYV